MDEKVYVYRIWVKQEDFCARAVGERIEGGYGESEWFPADSKSIM